MRSIPVSANFSWSAQCRRKPTTASAFLVENQRPEAILDEIGQGVCGAQNALIDKIMSAPMHILASMRAKTEWGLDRDDETGKSTPQKVGLAPVMRDGIEYEFDGSGLAVQHFLIEE
jgi:hypothetical protein